MTATDRTRAIARVAGTLYLVTHVTSVTAVVAYAGGLAPLGVALEFVLALGCAGTGVLVWVLLRDRAPARSATFAGLRAVEAAVILAGTLPMLALAWAVAPGAELAGALTGIHTASFLIGQGLVISVNTIVLGSALLSTRAVPRALAVLGIAGGAIVLASNAAQLFGVIPLNGAIAGACAVPVFAFEIWFAIRLIVSGVTSAPRDRAFSPAVTGASGARSA